MSDLTSDIPIKTTVYKTKSVPKLESGGEDYTAVSSLNHVNAVQIPTCNSGDTLKQMLGPTNMVVKKNGWIYIYVSNESAQDVYFDNLVINLRHGPLVEQKDYYPLGTENPALSTKALKLNYNENRRKFNAGNEYQGRVSWPNSCAISYLLTNGQKKLI